MIRQILQPLALLVLGSAAAAQWSPTTGSWGQQPARDVRVMTWNVQDGLCSTNAKAEGLGNWCALARVVAALRPDVLIVQEAGDNSGNGTGAHVDTVADLETTLDLFLHGGNDPFSAGNPAVTSWVGKYAPGYDLPYVFVSARTDGYNRDVILSRFPFADLNGDTRSKRSDMPTLQPAGYAAGPDGGLRGYQHAELDLPDADYAGDLVVGNSHLKSGPSASVQSERVEAAKDIAYFLDYLYNGAGSGVPDPQGAIADQPPATRILGVATPIVTGGDWNEDEVGDGSFRGPAAWISEAAFPDGPLVADGTDRNRTDMSLDDARDLFTGSGVTEGNSKLDYVAWQDSIARLRRSFVLDTATMPSAALPTEVLGFPAPLQTSARASDHLPVVVDLILPEPPLRGPGAHPVGAAPGSTSAGAP